MSRRHVWRAAVLYADAAWALSQGIAQLGPLFGAPNWAMRGFMIACIIGFPFWVAFAWFYAWTPEAFKREEEVERTPSLSRATSRRLDLGIIGVLIVAVVLLVSGYFVRHSAAAAARGAEATAKPFNPPADTLVVLPFANLSGDKSQKYFSDGITEELTNARGQNTALRVIGWDTASHYRDSTQPATAIGKALDVANVLTGKILRQGNAVLEQMPKFCARFAVACTDLTVNPLWLPLRGDPRFQALVKRYDTVSTPAAAATAAPASSP